MSFLRHHGVKGYMEELFSVPLSKKEINENYKYIKKELAKKGKGVQVA